MPALYPSMVAPEFYAVGDTVRKFISDQSVTPFLGTVTHIVPTTYKVWVQWPTGHTQESPEELIKVNPAISGMPTAIRDMGYDSYEKGISEKFRGVSPKKMQASDKMAIRIAHTFASTVVDRLVDAIVDAKDQGLSDIKAYNQIYTKFSSICSDYIIRSSVQKIYQ